MKRFFSDIRKLVQATFRKAAEDDIVTQGAAIAFYTIFSVTPLFILVVSVSGFFFSEEMITVQLRELMTNYLGEEMSANLSQFLSGASLIPASVWTSILATAIIIFGATTVITQLKHTLNRIWNVGQVKINTFWRFLINRLLSFGIIIILSLLLLTSLAAEGVIGLLSAFFVDLFPNVSLDFYRVLTRITTIGFAVAFFTIIFKILPDVHAPWKDMLIGAVVTTMLFMLGKYLIGLYLSASGIQATYRAAGTLIIVVIWVYYNIQTILLGAVFTQVYTELYGGRILPYRFVELREMTGIDRMMGRERKKDSEKEGGGERKPGGGQSRQ